MLGRVQIVVVVVVVVVVFGQELIETVVVIDRIDHGSKVLGWQWVWLCGRRSAGTSGIGAFGGGRGGSAILRVAARCFDLFVHRPVASVVVVVVVVAALCGASSRSSGRGSSRSSGRGSCGGTVGGSLILVVVVAVTAVAVRGAGFGGGSRRFLCGSRRDLQ